MKVIEKEKADGTYHSTLHKDRGWGIKKKNESRR